MADIAEPAPKAKKEGWVKKFLRKKFPRVAELQERLNAVEDEEKGNLTFSEKAVMVVMNIFTFRGQVGWHMSTGVTATQFIFGEQLLKYAGSLWTGVRNAFSFLGSVLDDVSKLV